MQSDLDRTDSQAGEALGALGQTSSLPLLEKYLRSDSQVIRETCELAIARIKWSHSKASPEEVLQQRYRLATILLTFTVPIPPSTQPLPSLSNRPHLQTLSPNSNPN